MKSICILCEHAKVNQVNSLLKSITGSEILKTPLSEKGENPVTHWFTYLKTNDIGFDKLILLQEHCIVEESNLKEFLKKHKLQVVKEEN